MDTCRHGEPMNSACEACGRYDDGSDGTLAGDYRARRKAWQEYLAREERERDTIANGPVIGVDQRQW